MSHGNEVQLIKIFEDIHPDDWVLSTWRNHYHALLHGIPKDVLMDKILDGKSISTNSAEHRFLVSAIVGGIPPIAVGIAAGLKANGSPRHVWCFVGDMCGSIGIFKDSQQYARLNDLPITFVIESNDLSTNTNTIESWGYKEGEITSDEFYCGRNLKPNEVIRINDNTLYYHYERKYPHVGIGKKVVMS